MKKRIIFSCMAAIAMTVAAYIGANTFSNKEGDCNNLLTENIEALTDIENEGIEDCSRAIIRLNCYDIHGNWVCMRNFKVERYKRFSLVEICHHDVVTLCPNGTHEVW